MVMARTTVGQSRAASERTRTRNDRRMAGKPTRANGSVEKFKTYNRAPASKGRNELSDEDVRYKGRGRYSGTKKPKPKGLSGNDLVTGLMGLLGLDVASPTGRTGSNVKSFNSGVTGQNTYGGHQSAIQDAFGRASGSIGSFDNSDPYSRGPGEPIRFYHKEFWPMPVRSATSEFGGAFGGAFANQLSPYLPTPETRSTLASWFAMDDETRRRREELKRKGHL